MNHGLGRSPGRTRGTTFTSRRFVQPRPSHAPGVGAPGVSAITKRAAQDLDQWYSMHGCTGCDDMGSDLRVRTLAFKSACLLDPATMNQVSLNVSTPLAQSGFGPGTDQALSLVLGNQRLSTGHCTDDNGYCTIGGLQTPAIPPEVNAIADALNKTINGVISSGQQAPQTDATLTMLVQQIVAAFQAFAAQLKAVLATQQKPAPPPLPPPPAIQPQPQPTPSPTPMPMAKTSGAGLALGVVGIALVALGTGAVIMTVSRKKKAGAR